MIWGCFAEKPKGTFAICQSKITGVAYRDLLELNLYQFEEEVFETPGEECIFMQGNPPVYTSHVAKDWLQGPDYIIMEWPPYSPNLNLIKQIW